MPKFGGHIVIGEEVARRLGYTEEELAGPLGAALRLGAVGPDLTLFLMDPANDNSFVFDALGKGMRAYHEFSKIRDRIAKVVEYFGEPTTNLADWMTGGLSTSVLESTGLAVQSLVSALKMVAFSKRQIEVVNPFKDLDTDVLRRVFGVDFAKWSSIPTIDLSTNLDSDDITSPAYIFRYFGHPYTHDPPYKRRAAVGDYSEWWWMDILHYRRTSEFARRLLTKAQGTGDPVLIAYAHGYFSHVGGDIVGHPYINSMVGGPFRSHALRHMVVESLLDVRIWQERKGAEIHSARLDQLVELGDDQRDRICKLISEAMTEVYARPDSGPSIATRHFHGAAPEPGDLATAYMTMSGYLSFSTDIGLSKPDRPAGSLGEVWDEIRGHVARTLGKIGAYAHDLGRASGWDWFAALLGLVMWSALLVIQLLTLGPAILTRIAAVGPRWIAYLINSAMHDFVRHARFAMALCGWGYAGTEDLGTTMGQRLLTVRSQMENDMSFPFRMSKRIDGFWLQHPSEIELAEIESPETISGPYKSAHGPAAFIDGLPFDTAHEAILMSLATPPGGENEVWTLRMLDRIRTADPASGFFGNAADFTVKLIEGKYPDAAFDLDGDRGYASLEWAGLPPNSVYLD